MEAARIFRKQFCINCDKNDWAKFWAIFPKNVWSPWSKAKHNPGGVA
jgi:hypothetical protein